MAANELVDCKRCGGKGYGPWHTEQGLCFLCNGSGRVRSGVVVKTYEVKYGPSSKARRRGMAIAIVAEFTQTTEVRGVRAHQQIVQLRIHGTGIDGKPVDQTFTDPEKIEAATFKMNTSDYLLSEF